MLNIQTVNSLADFQAYNTWLQQQVQTGKLGYGGTAQTNYNNAFKLAYHDTTLTWTYTPASQPFTDPDDPVLASGLTIGLQASGNRATGVIAEGGGMMTNSGVLTAADNDGTITNKGTLSVSGGAMLAQVTAGGHFVSNGQLYYGYSTPAQTTGNAQSPGDSVTGNGSTWVNNGVANLAGWSYSTTGTSNIQVMAVVGSGGTATNNGAMNVGSNPESVAGINMRGVNVQAGGTFINSDAAGNPGGYAGVIYLGRGISTDTISDPLLRGGSDVAQVNGATGIYLNNSTSGATSTARAYNNGTIIIGSQVQNGHGIEASGSNVEAHVGADGVITDNGNYTVAAGGAPLRNAAIYSTAKGTSIVDNGGTINLNGTNGTGLYVLSGGRASSGGTINVGISPLYAATGLRNYGIWSTGVGSQATLTGIINLTGNGAVGAYAESGGSVAVAGNGEVRFGNGTRQLGYYVFGPTASITNTGTGAQDVSTTDSVLFRVDGGASFTGGAGAGSTLTASGTRSVAMLANGKDAAGGNVSAFNSGTMTINAAGDDATGVLIQGGAQGKIDASASINLTGKGAVAGIADGQGYDISGNTLGSPVAGMLSNAALNAGASGFGTGTILVAGAALSSALDNVTGYIARNSAELSNSGSIHFTGTGTTGLRVEAGARGGNTGSITVGAGSTGITAEDATGTHTTVVNTSGNLVLNGGCVSERSVGITAAGAMTTVNMTGGTVSMNGNGAVGVKASMGATINLSGTATPTFGAGTTDQILFALKDAGSTINADGTAGAVFDASATRSTLYRLLDGASLTGSMQVAASGTDATGIYASGTGTTATVTAGSHFTLTGDGARGVYVDGGAQAGIQAGATMMLDSANAVAGMVDGNEYDQDNTTVLRRNTGAVLTNDSLITSAAGGTALVARNAGILNNTGDVLLTGANSVAVKVLGGEVHNSGNLTANGTVLYVDNGDQGQASVITSTGTILATDGRAAIELAGGALSLGGTGLTPLEARGTAHGILTGTGATGLDVDHAHIIVSASGAHGNGIENAGNLAGIRLSDTTIDVRDGAGVRTATTLAATNSGTINVTGAGTGILFGNADGSATAEDLDLSDSSALQINVTGAGGTGIMASTTGTVDTAVNVSVSSADGGPALRLGDAVTKGINRGTLASASAASPTVDTGLATNFINAVTGIISASASGADAVTMRADGAVLENDGTITGNVKMAGRNGTVHNTGTVSGDVNTTAGDNAVTVDGGRVSGNIALAGTGSNTVLLTGGATVSTVTVRGRGNTFTALNGGTGLATAVFDGADYTLSDAAAISQHDQLNLTGDTRFTLATALAGKAAIDVDHDATLAVTPATPAPFILTNRLTGDGLVTVSTGAGNAFDFAATTGNAFAGTLDMGAGTFALGGLNTATLTHATLKGSAGSVTTVADGQQHIAGLTLNGGRVIFNASVPGDAQARSLIVTDRLDTTGGGSVQVTVPDPYQAPAVDTGVNLLTQDDKEVSVQLVSAQHVTGSGGGVTLVDQNGTPVAPVTGINIAQGGSTVAVASYGLRTTTAPGDGLYVNYGLTQLDLQQGQTLTLAEDSGATGASADMSAKLTGQGSLAVEAGQGILSLSSNTNDYTGDTTVRTGTLRADTDHALGLTRSLNVDGGATADLNGTSQQVGALNMQAGSRLQLDGTLRITEAQRTVGDTNGGFIEAGTLSGQGHLVIDPSVLQVNGANQGYTGNVTVTGGSTLILNNTAGTGDSGLLTLDTAADTLELGNVAGYAGVVPQTGDTMTKQLAGQGTVRTRDGADVTLGGDNRAFAGTFDVLSGTTLRASARDHLGTAAIQDNGTVSLDTGGAFTLTNRLTGNGVLAVTTGAGNAFSLASSVGGDFAGTADLGPGTFALGDMNTTALTNATLKSSAGNVTTVADGRQHIGGLTFSGGTVAFDATVPGDAQAQSLVVAKALDARGTGTVQVALASPYVASPVDTGINLLRQDDGNTGTQLVQAQQVTGSGGALSLVDQNGNPVGSPEKLDIAQDGSTVAVGSYGFRTTTAPGDGLYVNYGLTQLDLLQGQTLTLAEDAGATGAAADMSARITGAGSLRVAGHDVVSLSNSTNDYTGDTLVAAGTLRTDADNALGHTGILHLAGQTTADLNGTAQTIQQLDGQADSVLALNGGTLNVADGGRSSGSLTGAGQLNVNGGTLDVQGANAGLRAATTIAGGATVQLTDAQGLGNGSITDNGTLQVTLAENGLMRNAVAGTGDMIKQGEGTLTAGAALKHTGKTDILAGALVAAEGLGGEGAGTVSIAEGAALASQGTVGGQVNNAGMLSLLSAWPGHEADGPGTLTLAQGLTSSGVVNLAGSSTGNQLIVSGDYTGHDGRLDLNTELGGDDSATDRLVVKGSTHGSTRVRVNNAGGHGAQTVEGIRIVEVGGQSDGTFIKDRRIAAGAYEYDLVQKGRDWFLTSLKTTPSTPAPSDADAMLRPEAGSYTANLAAANTMFFTRLHDRLGETQYTDALTGEQKVTSLWLRQVGGHNAWKDSSGQLDTQSNRYVVQLGGEVAQWSTDGLQRLHLGVMAGYGHNSSNTHSDETGYRSDGTVSGYSAGLYATWFQNDTTKQGLYVDSWAQYSWFDNDVKGQDLQGESYKSDGITASLETGYTHRLGEFAGSQGALNEWYIQPQVQVTWMGVKADAHRESNGTRVSGQGDGNLQTRLGVRTFLKGHSKADEGKDRTFEPFVEVNWIHNTEDFGTRMDDVSVHQEGTRNLGEVKTGVEGQLNRHLNLWGNVGVQVGDKGYSDASATIGIKYSF